MMMRTRWVACAVALAALHLVVLFAGFFAPYDPAAQNRHQPYSSPTHLHFVDPTGAFHWRPFFYPAPRLHGQTTSLQFFVEGAPYRVLGFIPAHVHLFGTAGPPFFLFGSDAYGRDLFSRVLYGGQVSLLSGLIGTALTLSIGFLVGAAAGFYGRWTDDILMRVAELFLALPWIYLLLALRAFLPLAVPPLQALSLVVAVIGLVGWARPARLVRSVVLSAKERDFVRASRGFGASGFYLLRRHMLPETTSLMLTQMTILVPQFVLAEMTLSFLGLGIPEPVPSWGNILASLQQYSVLVSYWWMYLPVLVIVPFFVGYLTLASLLQADVRAYKIEGFGRGVELESNQQQISA